MQNLDLVKKVLIPAISYGLIIYFFSRALLNPLDNVNFIYNVGIFIFVTEFLSVHSAVMLSAPEKTSQKLIILPLYLIFIVIISMITHMLFPAIMFALSLGAKVVQKSNAKLEIAYPAIIFVISAFAVLIFGGLFADLFTLPQEVLDQKPANSSGLFVEKPQTLLIWGILYYSSLIALSIWQTINEIKKDKYK